MTGVKRERKWGVVHGTSGREANETLRERREYHSHCEYEWLDYEQSTYQMRASNIMFMD